MKVVVRYHFKGRTGWFEEQSEHETPERARAAVVAKAHDIEQNGYWEELPDGRSRWTPPSPISMATIHPMKEEGPNAASE